MQIKLNLNFLQLFTVDSKDGRKTLLMHKVEWFTDGSKLKRAGIGGKTAEQEHVLLKCTK